jgi:hypothetical protein
MYLKGESKQLVPTRQVFRFFFFIKSEISIDYKDRTFRENLRLLRTRDLKRGT